ncbi:FAD-dependent oxidoreductase [Natranaerobius trueperi]|uniref:CoA-disulfide reductase n=1 Tax=Natranaerobius trueperi TaxID=759412 RepID=A0A226C0R7_9FIRM|nr:FAD-dependent oxidoreductase [Natranaerobius trueperi]OWZ84775.1 CoA-disulfide reductase [Natranaerobius trueperi]
MSKRVIIIGGNAAGLSAASQIKRQDASWDVTVVEKSDEISYASCGIPYFIQGEVTSSDQLFALTTNDLKEKRGIDLKLNHEVRKVLPRENSLVLSSQDKEYKESYDYLVVASGVSPNLHNIDITSRRENSNIFTIKSIKDGINIKNSIEKYDISRVGIIGGGYIALEMVEVFSLLGYNTTLIHRRNQFSKAFEPEVSEHMKDVLKKNNVTLELETKIASVIEKNDNITVRKSDETSLNFDILIVAIGVTPSTKFLKNSGIEYGIKGSIRVNEYLQTNISNIYAAGDVAEAKNIVTKQPTFSPLALKANKEGSITGTNIVKNNVETFPGVLNSSIMKLFDTGVARTGITESEAKSKGYHVKKIRIESNTKPKYYPDSSKVTLFINFDEHNGKLLGGQIIGPLNEVKRIDVLSGMIQSEKTIQDLYHLDLAYAPPFSPVYDPIVLAGRVGKKYVRN